MFFAIFIISIIKMVNISCKKMLWKYIKYIQVITEFQKIKAALPSMRLAISKPFLNSISCP